MKKKRIKKNVFHTLMLVLVFFLFKGEAISQAYMFDGFQWNVPIDTSIGPYSYVSDCYFQDTTNFGLDGLSVILSGLNDSNYVTGVECFIEVVNIYDTVWYNGVPLQIGDTIHGDFLVTMRYSYGFSWVIRIKGTPTVHCESYNRYIGYIISLSACNNWMYCHDEYYVPEDIVTVNQGNSVERTKDTFCVQGLIGDSSITNSTMSWTDGVNTNIRIIDSSGIYTFVYEDSLGCSIYKTYDVQVGVKSNQYISSCYEVNYNGDIFTTSQTLYDTIVGGAAIGCDSIVVTHIEVYDDEISDQNITWCNEGVLNGTTYTYSQTVYDTVIGGASNGCNLINRYDIVIYENAQEQIQIDACDSFEYQGTTYTASQIIYDTIAGGSQHGCDSTIELHVTIGQNTNGLISQSITACNYYNLHGTVYTNSQMVYDTLVNQTGCDSIIKYNLSIYQDALHWIQTNIMYGDSILIGGVYYHLAGTYYDTLQTQGGCDSVIQYDVNVLPNSIEEKINAAAGIQVFPNPFNETLTVRLNQMSPYINIYNLLGEVVLQQQIPSHTQNEVVVDVSNLESGIYIVEVEGAGRVKVVKE